MTMTDSATARHRNFAKDFEITPRDDAKRHT